MMPAPPLAALAILTTSPLPSATVGSSYSETIVGSGGSGLYAWSLISASPNFGGWIAGINSTSGALITGTPGNAETETLVVQLTDTVVGNSVQKTFSLSVSAGASSNLIGANVPAGGGGSYQLVFEGFPIFKNRAREGLYFQLPTSSPPVALSAAGWPAADFQIQLTSGPYGQPWQAGGNWTGGFIGTGSETVAATGSMVLGTVTHGSGGAYTTFTMTSTTGQFGGFKVTGTSGGVTNVFCNIPEYPASAVDNPASSAAFTTEAIAYYSQFAILRFMEWNNAITNEAVMSASNRSTLANAQIEASTSAANDLTIGLSAAPAMSAISATLSAPWPYPYTVVNISIPYSGGNYSRLATFSQGSTAVSWASGGGGLASAGTEAYFYVGLGDDYPMEWQIGFALACGNSPWLNFPLFEDGANYCSGTYSQAIFTYLNANWTSSRPVYIEITNEIFNTHGGAVNNAASVFGFSSGGTYMGYKLHALANSARTYAPTLWANGLIRIVFAGQFAGTGVGVYGMSIVLNYMNTTYGAGTVAADLFAYADAPYVTPVIGTMDSVATIEANIIAQSPQNLYTHGAENTFIMSSHYGLMKMAYESGLQWNSVSTINTNAGAAIQDTSGGYETVIQSYYNYCFNSGYQVLNHFKPGVYMAAAGNATVPTDQPTTTYANANTAPTMLGLQAIYSGYSMVRNVVTSPGAGSSIPGGNYADTTSGGSPYFGQANAYQTGPYYGVPGYLSWILNVETAGTYTITGTFTTTQSGHLNVEVTGGNVIGTIAIPNGLGAGQVVLGSVHLNVGPNYICLGNGTNQTGIFINTLEVS
jgi:hypothetical protein